MSVTTARTLEQVVECMYSEEVLQAISEIIQSIRDERDVVSTQAKCQRDVVAEAFFEYLGDVRPQKILLTLLDELEGLQVVEWWKTELLGR